jgi:hypothetical protein
MDKLIVVLVGLALIAAPVSAMADDKQDHGWKGAGWYDAGDSLYGVRLYSGPYSSELVCVNVTNPIENDTDHCVYYDRDPNA